MIGQAINSAYPIKPLFRYLSTNGDGTGTTNAIGNYSGAPAYFYISSFNTLKTFYVTDLIFQYSANGSFSQSGYANGVALTNGIDIQYWQNDDAIFTVNDSRKIKTNDGFVHSGFDYQLITFSGAVNSVAAKYSFVNPIILNEYTDGWAGWFTVILNDDFTGLTDQTFYLKGYYVDKPTRYGI